jgi:hypothetical protein
VTAVDGRPRRAVPLGGTVASASSGVVPAFPPRTGRMVMDATFSMDGEALLQRDMVLFW